MLGPRVDAWRIVRRPPPEDGTGFWHRLATWVMRRPIGVAIELLAGIPSIIYGIWGVYYFKPVMQAYIQPFLIKTLGDTPVVGALFAGPPLGSLIVQLAGWPVKTAHSPVSGLQAPSRAASSAPLRVAATLAKLRFRPPVVPVQLLPRHRTAPSQCSSVCGEPSSISTAWPQS